MTWWMRLGAAEMRRHKLRTALIGALVFVPVTSMVVASVVVASITQPVSGEYIQAVSSDGCQPNGTIADCDLEAVAASVVGGTRHQFGTTGNVFVAEDRQAEGFELLELSDPEAIFGPNARLVRGRFPQRQGEVTLTPAQLDTLGAELGDRVHFDVPEGEATVVGEVLVQGAAVGFVAPGTLTAGTGMTDPTGAASRQPAAFVVMDDRSAPLIHPSTRYLHSYGDFPKSAEWDPVAFVPLVGGAALIWLALVASTGLAIGARRRRRELGLLVATGADPVQLRLASVGEGFVLGLAGSVLGLVCGLAVAAIATPWLLSRFDSVADAVVVPWSVVLFCAVLGVVAAAAAGDLATRALRHQTPLELLAEAALTPRPARRWFVAGAVLWSAAFVGLVLDRRGAFSLQTEWTARLLTGAACAAGLVAFVVGGVRLIGRVTGMLPFPWHLAGADLTRHGARVAAAAAAVSLTLAGALGAAAASTNPGRSAAGTEGYGSLVLTMSRLQIDDGRLVESTPVDVDALLEGLDALDLDVMDLTQVPCTATICQFTELAVPSTQAALRRLPPSTAEHLAQGLVVLPSNLEGALAEPVELGGIEVRQTATPGQVEIQVGDRSVSAVIDRNLQWYTLMPQPLLDELGLRADGRREVVVDSLELAGIAEVNGVLEAHGAQPLYDPAADDENGRRMAVGVMVAAGAVSLVVAVLALALVRAESLDEDRTLVELGADGRRRRSVNAARGALTLLAATVPALLGAILLARVRMRAPGLGIPLWSVLVVAVLPVCAWVVNLVVARPRRWDSRTRT